MDNNILQQIKLDHVSFNVPLSLLVLGGSCAFITYLIINADYGLEVTKDKVTLNKCNLICKAA